MDKVIRIHNADPEDQATLAVIGPTGQILGTDDPALTRRILDALNDPRGGYDPRTGGWLPGPPARYAPGTADGALAVLNALVAHGLRGTTVGYPALEPPSGPPGREY